MKGGKQWKKNRSGTGCRSGICECSGILSNAKAAEFIEKGSEKSWEGNDVSDFGICFAIVQ